MTQGASGDVVPRVELYDSEGFAVALPDSGSINEVLTSGDTYTLLAFSDINEIGTYELSLDIVRDLEANAGADQAVIENQLVTLDGSASTVPGSQIAYSWSQVRGPSVILNNDTSAKPSFISPCIVSRTELEFELMAIDVDSGVQSSPDSVVVTVVSTAPPVADAGEDIVAVLDETVILDGSGSFDPDGIITNYE